MSGSRRGGRCYGALLAVVIVSTSIPALAEFHPLGSMMSPTGSTAISSSRVHSR